MQDDESDACDMMASKLAGVVMSEDQKRQMGQLLRKWSVILSGSLRCSCITSTRGTVCLLGLHLIPFLL